MSLPSSLDGKFFRSISASGFGLMRIAWGLTVFIGVLMEQQDVVRYYSSSGLVPSNLEPMVLRESMRFTLLDWFTSPGAVFVLYFLLLFAALSAIIGLWPKFSTLAATLLLFSFHERATFLLGGGDTTLRVIGFILILAPNIDAFSWKRLERQWAHWKRSGTLLHPGTMPAWPRILLLWQFTVIYLMSGIDKLSGDMWRSGTAVASVLHHPHFTRWPMWLMDKLSTLGPVFTYATLAWEFSWLLLYIPKFLSDQLPWYNRHAIRRIILCAGLLFHGAIFLLFDVGSFSPAMLSGYFGLLLQEDFDALRRFFGRSKEAPIAVFYDGKCGLCRRSMFGFLILDHLHRLQPINFRDTVRRKEVAPDLQEEELDRAMHIRTKSGRTEKGFFAFRILARHLPVLLPIYPFLYIPGVPALGQQVYARIAERRNRCTHESCDV